MVVVVSGTGEGDLGQTVRSELTSRSAITYLDPTSMYSNGLSGYLKLFRAIMLHTSGVQVQAYRVAMIVPENAKQVVKQHPKPYSLHSVHYCTVEDTPVQ